MIKILGHDRPVISLPIKSNDDQQIKNLFNDTFNKLSNKSIDITPILMNPQFQSSAIGRNRCDILKEFIEQLVQSQK